MYIKSLLGNRVLYQTYLVILKLFSHSVSEKLSILIFFLNFMLKCFILSLLIRCISVNMYIFLISLGFPISQVLRNYVRKSFISFRANWFSSAAVIWILIPNSRDILNIWCKAKTFFRNRGQKFDIMLVSNRTFCCSRFWYIINYWT